MDPLKHLLQSTFLLDAFLPFYLEVVELNFIKVNTILRKSRTFREVNISISIFFKSLISIIILFKWMITIEYNKKSDSQ